MTAVKNTLSFLVAFLVATSTIVFAEEYISYVPGIPAAAGDSSGGHLETFFARYDTDTEELEFSLRFLPAPVTNAVVQGYTMVWNDGPLPRNDGEYVMFYADFTDPDNPTLVAYVYGRPGRTGSHQDGSRATGTQAPDLIASTLIDPAFVKNFTIVDNAADQSRTINLKIDGAIINGHTPLYPTTGVSYKGVSNNGRPPVFGMWFYPTSGLSVTYKSGYVENYNFRKQGNYDVINVPLYTRPECQSVPAQPVTVNVGETFSGLVLGTDLGFNGQLEPLTVSYSGLPTGAQVTPAEGTSGNPPVTASVTWTPTVADQGSSYTIDVTFTDSIGLDVTCPLVVNVPQNKPPVCKFSEQNYQNQCEGLNTTVNIDATGSIDPEGKTLTYSWDLNCDDPKASISGENTLTPTVTLEAPGTGLGASCTLELTLSDGIDSSSCEASIGVPACEIDCLGNPNGNAEVDICGVCEGDGTSCLDCLDIPFGTATEDRCGVCDGNGLSCVNCVTTDNTPNNGALDGLAKEQHQLNRRIARAARKADRGANKVKKFTRDRLGVSKDARNDNWIVSWNEIPQSLNECEETPFCVEVSLSSSSDSYTQNSVVMRSVGEQLIARYEALMAENNGKKNTKRAKKFERRLNEIYDDAQLILNGIPATFSCE